MARSGGYALTTADGARAIAARIRRRDVTATEVVSDHLGRLDEARRTIGGVAWSDDERVLVEAGAADDVVARGDVVLGPLHGVPVTVKDWIDVAGFPVRGRERSYRDRRPEHDATVVTRLPRCGGRDRDREDRRPG